MINLEQILSIALLAPMDDPMTFDPASKGAVANPECRWGAPIVFWGPPGIGKSGRVEQAGAAVGLPVETLYLSTHQPEDLSGIPMPDGNGGVENVCSLVQVRELVKYGKGILFLDELSTARPAMQGAGLGVVYNRRVAGKRLPGRIRVVGAANPPEEAAGGWALAPPMANRFLHIAVGVPDVDEWTSWLLSGANQEIIPVEAGERRISERWNDVYAKIRGLGAGFMRRNRTQLFDLPKPGNPARGRAWRSPRSWEVALRCMAAAEALDMKDLGIELLQASVGEGSTKEWLEWIQYANLPDPEEMLKNGWKPDKKRLDVAYAAYGSAISFALGKTDKAEQKKYAILAWKLLNTGAEMNLTDIVLAPAASLMRAGYNTRAGGDVAAVCQDLIARFGSTGLANFVRKP
jgi:MoxR-like ATPase